MEAQARLELDGRTAVEPQPVGWPMTQRLIVETEGLGTPECDQCLCVRSGLRLALEDA